MIKIGQIYLYKDETSSARIAITGVWGRGFSMVNHNGYALTTKNETLNGCKLLAEYPTWQEAIASKEFNEKDATAGIEKPRTPQKTPQKKTLAKSTKSV